MLPGITHDVGHSGVLPARVRLGMADLVSIRPHVRGMNLGARRSLSEAGGWDKKGHQAKRPDPAACPGQKRKKLEPRLKPTFALIDTGRAQ